MKRLFGLFENKYGASPVTVVPLTGSASNRKYFRMSAGDFSCIGVVGTDKRENDAFVTLGRHLSSKGLSVPQIYDVSEDGLTYIQEDLGDDVLYDLFVKEGNAGDGTDKVEALLCAAISLLPKLQFEGADGLDFVACCPQPVFDRRLVNFDLNYFKYCFLKPSGLEFDDGLLQDDFDRFADDILECGPDAFMYRDFQSRNVMVKDGEPYFIDFQSGRRGPIYYDVASFIWHPRSGYPQELKDKMLESYLGALSRYVDVDRDEFETRLRLFILLRYLQVLGAYGFRGLIENKARFMTAVPAALQSLEALIETPFDRYPYLMKILKGMVALPRFADRRLSDGGRLEVRVYSFSYKKGVPVDMSGNGGGYVFDCRSIHNPGRYESYKKLTGRDEPVIRFLEDDGEVFSFLEHVYGVVDPHVETFMNRGFTDLMVSFGCTGGQHRSVYCAEHLANHLAGKYPDIVVRLIHREQNVDKLFLTDTSEIQKV